MSDEGYTWLDHVERARGMMWYATGGTIAGDPGVDDVRQSLFEARASLTRAIALLHVPEDKDAA